MQHIEKVFRLSATYFIKMSGTQPVAVYGLKVPPGDILIPAVPDFAAMVCTICFVGDPRLRDSDAKYDYSFD